MTHKISIHCTCSKWVIDCHVIDTWKGYVAGDFSDCGLYLFDMKVYFAKKNYIEFFLHNIIMFFNGVIECHVIDIPEGCIAGDFRDGGIDLYNSDLEGKLATRSTWKVILQKTLIYFCRCFGSLSEIKSYWARDIRTNSQIISKIWPGRKKLK